MKLYRSEKFLELLGCYHYSPIHINARLALPYYPKFIFVNYRFCYNVCLINIVAFYSISSFRAVCRHMLKRNVNHIVFCFLVWLEATRIASTVIYFLRPPLHISFSVLNKKVNSTKIHIYVKFKWLIFGTGR